MRSTRGSADDDDALAATVADLAGFSGCFAHADAQSPLPTKMPTIEKGDSRNAMLDTRARVYHRAVPESAPLLEVKNLVTTFHTDEGELRAVDGVAFQIEQGETVGLVGESGCGKSVTSLSILRLIPEPPGKIASGQILFEGKNLIDLTEREMRSVRGNQISMIFQEPMTSLNPVYDVGDQIVEAIRLHQKKSRKEARERAVDLLALVGIPSPKTNANAYPHELSGGMRQRVMIAMALACEPKLLIADEPTTALDVTIQAQILELLKKLQDQLKMSVLLITHDLGVVAEYTEHVVVMYAGRVVERAPVRDLFARPKHPYTKGLLESIPKLGARHGARRRLPTIEGMVPSLIHPPVGCRFADRCNMVIDLCREKEPALLAVGENRWSRCHRAEEL
jgi:oligopeptide/dipeptide ABC transporter ATP-binding protein